MMRRSPERHLPQAPFALVRLLVQVSRADPVYRDLYLQRARAALQAKLPRAEYAHLKAVRPAIDRALRETREAVVCGEWERVRDFADTLESLQRSLDASAEALVVAADVYEPEMVALDPLAPGFERLGTSYDIGAVLDRVRLTLAELERLDPEWEVRYAGRRRYFEGRAMAPTDRRHDPGSKDTRSVAAEALRALDKGHVDHVRNLAEQMLGRARARGDRTGEPDLPTSGHEDGRLSQSISPEAVARSGALGLAYAELPAVPELAEYIRRSAWHPGFAEGQQTADGATRVLAAADDPTRPRAPESLRDLAELFAMHPYLNSGGGRYLPRFRAQPVLFEDFAEDVEAPSGPLLAALGLGQRHALSRVEIEAALLEHGATILTDGLGLDPWQYRLLCIPFDVYARVGSARGWGCRPQWTHFDGYQLMRNGHLRALVGGDVRYGGLYDLVSIGADDKREKVIARFAVVRRERLLTALS